MSNDNSGSTGSYHKTTEAQNTIDSVDQEIKKAVDRSGNDSQKKEDASFNVEGFYKNSAVKILTTIFIMYLIYVIYILHPNSRSNIELFMNIQFLIIPFLCILPVLWARLVFGFIYKVFRDFKIIFIIIFSNILIAIILKEFLLSRESQLIYFLYPLLTSLSLGYYFNKIALNGRNKIWNYIHIFMINAYFIYIFKTIYPPITGYVDNLKLCVWVLRNPCTCLLLYFFW